ncbi:uncharacterized protein LOC135136866 isoform X2 [Zophobas morio]|uniref:uncharacterized protein LOC135136866 isoform X2 n=1 Tax=Zophobas morio TaxID=2755281 RepID=UPI00308293F5
MWGFLPRFNKDPHATPDDVNLLLLGETGVGKSTLINSISNYFIHSNFAKAQKEKVEILIPMCLNISEKSKVYGKPDDNEVHEPGQSVTQNVKVHLFPIKLDRKTINLRLIDTPGVGDPRGIEQDNINLDNVLAYLATLKELHGICFVLKANQTRFTQFAEYCLKQILTRLDKSASQNIIFITTYSKTSGYTAGETKSHCLEPLVRSIRSRPPHVSIPLSDKNIFAVDNEGFKALLEIQDGTNYDRHAMKGFEQSWIKSTKEIQRLLKYIIGDSKHSALNPHDVENTVSINEVRFLIEQLTTLIAEVSELIQDNTRVLDKHARVHIEKTVNNENQRRTELEAERAIISKTIAKFACFLQEHALIPFNDLYSVYIKQRIKDETDLGKSADQQVITKFESMLKEHEQLQKTLQENPRGLQAASSHLTLEEIKNSVTELYNLKHMGKKIQELIKKSSNSRRKERQKKFRCTVEQEIILDKATVEDNDHKGHQSVSRNPKSRTQDDMHEKLIRISEIAKNDENFIQNKGTERTATLSKNN